MKYLFFILLIFISKFVLADNTDALAPFPAYFAPYGDPAETYIEVNGEKTAIKWDGHKMSIDENAVIDTGGVGKLLKWLIIGSIIMWAGLIAAIVGDWDIFVYPTAITISLIVLVDVSNKLFK